MDLTLLLANIFCLENLDPIPPRCALIILHIKSIASKSQNNDQVKGHHNCKS